MRDSIEEMIEGFIEASSGRKTEKERGPTPLSAAQAVRDAVLKDKGRRKGLWTWKPVARKTLNKRRMSNVLWQSVLDTGVQEGLFHVDKDSLSYPILVATPQSPLEPDGGLEGSKDEEGLEGSKDEEGLEESKDEESTEEKGKKEGLMPPIPKGWDPPRFLDCGHSNRQDVLKTREECTEEELARLGDLRLVVPYKTIRVNSPEECTYCQRDIRPKYQFQRGKYRQSVPERLRRTQKKTDGPGHPGLCVDPKTGLYIGGVGNICNRYHEGPERCVVHTSRKSTTQKRKSSQDSRKKESS